MSTGLTIEEIITMGYYDNPLIVNKNLKWYKRQFKRLKKIHNFSFNLRGKLTPARKASITKLYNQHYIALGKIERGVYSFVPATRWQKTQLKENFPSTNKGFIYNHPIDPKTKRTTKIVGRGKNTRMVDKVIILDPNTGKKQNVKVTFYIPFPREIDRVNHQEFTEFVNQLLKPDFISISINGHAGKSQRIGELAVKYSGEFSDIKGDDGKSVFTGLYIIYYFKNITKKRLNKWAKNINKKISIIQNTELPY